MRCGLEVTVCDCNISNETARLSLGSDHGVGENSLVTNLRSCSWIMHMSSLHNFKQVKTHCCS